MPAADFEHAASLEQRSNLLSHPRSYARLIFSTSSGGSLPQYVLVTARFSSKYFCAYVPWKKSSNENTDKEKKWRAHGADSKQNWVNEILKKYPKFWKSTATKSGWVITHNVADETYVTKKNWESKLKKAWNVFLSTPRHKGDGTLAVIAYVEDVAEYKPKY